jgi:hypothetical protein
MRIRILEVVNERDMSPIKSLHLGLAPEFDTSKKSLSHISYHFRELEKAGCLEIVDHVPRRGATEHVYRGRARAFFTDEEWAALTPRERCLISRTMYQGLAARAEMAMLSHTFDSRPDRHLTWVAMEVDERGWGDLMSNLAKTYYKAEEIRVDAQDRLAGSGLWRSLSRLSVPELLQRRDKCGLHRTRQAHQADGTGTALSIRKSARRQRVRLLDDG